LEYLLMCVALDPRSWLVPLAFAALAPRAVAQGCPGEVKSHLKISATSGGFGGALDDDLFGHAVVALGDLDGDGFVDLAASAPADDDGGADQGAVWVLFLGSGSLVTSEQKISETSGGFGGVLAPSNRFGYSLAALGDLDGDGVEDLAVGAPFDDATRGAVWILFLATDGTVAGEQKISGTVGGFGGTLDPDGRFGGAVSTLGDLDGDGVVDLAVGANTDDDGGADRGAVWVLFLNADGTVKDEQKLSDLAGGFGGTLGDGDQLGFSLASLGDLDGDGRAELCAGAWQSDAGGALRGAVWVLFLAANGTVLDEQEISSTAGGFGGVLADGDGFGASVAGLGDVDADGVPDLAVGAPLDDDGGAAQGAVWIVLLAADGTVQGQELVSALDGGFTGDLDPGDIFGYGVAALGDLDGDGRGDLAAGAPQDDDGGAQRGAFWILRLGDGVPPVLACPGEVFAPTPKGAPQSRVVSFSVGVSDLCDPAPALVCVPPSGSVFPLGTTQVTCTATDASGNQTVCTFDVVVRPTIRPR
jgi:HYR domain-containing protein/FG-GAP repeat protein